MNNKGDSYTVVKYELKWHKDYPFWAFMTIPFVSLFKDYGYVRNINRYGRYTKKDIREGRLDESLSYIWEHGNELDIETKTQISKNRNSFKSLLDKYNKEFNENYK